MSEWPPNEKWSVVPLRRLFKVVNGGTPPNEEVYWDGDVCWVTPEDLSQVDGGIIEGSRRTITEEAVQSTNANLVSPGSLVVSTRAPVGYIARAAVPTSFNQGCRGLVPTTKLDERFFCYQLLAARTPLSELGRGSTFTELPASELADFRVVVPPLKEQRHISDYLDAETGRIDALISKNQQVLRRLHEREDAVIASSLGDDVIFRADSLPVGLAGWPSVPLRYAARVQTGLALNNQAVLADAVEVPYLSVANVHDGGLDLEDVKTVRAPRWGVKRWRLQPGDVLMTEGGDPDKLGRGAMWDGAIDPCLHQNHVFAVRPDSRVLRPEFLSLVTRHPYARMYFEVTASKTTGIASTSVSKIGAFRVPLPRLDEQRRLVAEVQGQLDQLRTVADHARRQQRLLAERREALITAAVTGQLEAAQGAAA